MNENSDLTDHVDIGRRIRREFLRTTPAEVPLEPLPPQEPTWVLELNEIRQRQRLVSPADDSAPDPALD
jgi:hypothetical protein